MSDPTAQSASGATSTRMLGLRTAIYSAPDLDAASAWYADVLGFEPYFSEPFYVGFNVGGYELGLMPDADGAGPGGVQVFWGVSDADAAFDDLVARGARPDAAVKDVGDGIKVATVLDPWGNVFGIIENPHFNLP